MEKFSDELEWINLNVSVSLGNEQHCKITSSLRLTQKTDNLKA